MTNLPLRTWVSGLATAFGSCMGVYAGLRVVLRLLFVDAFPAVGGSALCPGGVTPVSLLPALPNS